MLFHSLRKNPLYLLIQSIDLLLLRGPLLLVHLLVLLEILYNLVGLLLLGTKLIKLLYPLILDCLSLLLHLGEFLSLPKKLFLRSLDFPCLVIHLRRKILEI